MTDKFHELFKQKPVIGMIHLAGDDRGEKVERAKEELRIYDGEGLDGAIIENYHGDGADLDEVLSETAGMDLKLVKGLNFLGNYDLSFGLARKYNVRFIQIDSVQSNHLNLELYDELRQGFPEIVVLGGVGFKYTSPSNLPLERELEECRKRCDAVVTTGEGTGIETPIEKLREYRRMVGNFPLIVGAGVNRINVYEQFKVVDGIIVGSSLKPEGNTALPVDRELVRKFIEAVNSVR